MSACACSERRRPATVHAGSNEPARRWVVLRRNESCSAFNGYRRGWSAVSHVWCRVCHAYWGTRMDVSPFPDESYEVAVRSPKLEPFDGR